MNIERERVDGLLRGALGGIAGLVAMRLFMEAASALESASGDGTDQGADQGPRENDEGDGEADREGPIEGIDALDDISVGEQKSRDEEPATETMGRIAHEAVAGVEPSEERRHRLGQAVHWSYGVLVGGIYGATRAEAETPDVLAGLGYGTALWAVGDELMVPLLGLAEGPTAHGWTTHAKALGAHLAYGAATSSATQALKRIM